MVGGRDGAAARQLQTLLGLGAVGALGDGQLLGRFATERGEAAELAFAVLVERHGPMVLRVCRAALGDEHEAQDAFQATFLVLARRCGSLRGDGSLGPWLYGVARRVASCAHAAAARRRRHERRAAEQAPIQSAGGAGQADLDLERSLHDEIGRLPERFRVAVVLCLLDGLSHEQAARRLGWPLGTVKSRLATGRARLRTRLIRRGLAPSAAVLRPATPSQAAPQTVPAALAHATVQGAMGLGTGKTAAPAAVSVLTQGALRMMFLNKLKMAGAVLLAAGVGVGGGIGLALQPAGGAQTVTRAVSEGNGPAAAPKTEPAAQPYADLSDRLREEQELLAAQLDRKKAELERAEAEVLLASTVVTTNKRLNDRRPGFVSKEEMQKAESQVSSATAQVEIARAELRELELRREQLKRIQDQPERLADYLARRERAESYVSLERRLREVERKLNVLLEALDRSKQIGPAGGPEPSRR
jgi:RNA polymerase sigma factor (sigma-70 family)